MTDPKISLTEVEHVARLARLDLDAAEKERMRRQLDQILTYIDTLRQVNTTGVPPTAHVLPLVNVMREDEVRPSYPVEAMLQNAPRTAGDLIRVPRILED